VPLLTIATLLAIDFHPGNFVAGGGFVPFGFHGVFAALPAGVVFALQGFEQATQMAGESVNPQKHVAKAIILAMAIGTVVYLGLQLAFVGALDPAALAANGWAHPIGAGDYGPYYTIAVSAGVIWLAVVLIVDAVVSPGGTGLIYVGTTARISYALGLPQALTRVNVRGVPVWSVVVATVFGVLFLAPAPSWQQLVAVITGATSIMYAFAPIALGALLRTDPDRAHPYRLPAPRLLLPVGFAFANLIIYWGGFAATWQLAIGLLVGQVIYVVAAAAGARSVAGQAHRWRSAWWLWPWLLGLVLLGLLGNFGAGALHVLPEDWDALVVGVFAVVVHEVTVRTAQPRADVEAAVEHDLREDRGELRTPPGIA
jgi:amino acid transporter